MDKILLIIPAYNEEESIERVINNLEKNFPQYDYVIVNDGSKDNSLKIIQELEELDYKYKIGLIDLNVGLEAILCAYCS